MSSQLNFETEGPSKETIGLLAIVLAQLGFCRPDASWGEIESMVLEGEWHLLFVNLTVEKLDEQMLDAARARLDLLVIKHGGHWSLFNKIPPAIQRLYFWLRAVCRHTKEVVKYQRQVSRNEGHMGATNSTVKGDRDRHVDLENNDVHASGQIVCTMTLGRIPRQSRLKTKPTCHNGDTDTDHTMLDDTSEEKTPHKREHSKRP